LAAAELTDLSSETGPGYCFVRSTAQGIKHHRVRAIQSKLGNSPFAACWKTELAKAGITEERLSPFPSSGIKRSLSHFLF
jgi:hypothetical protein